MKEFELSQDAVSNLEEQIQKTGADKDDDRRDDDPVEQSLEVPTERSADDATEFVQKQYEDKSGLELDEDSAREIVKTAQSGNEDSSDGESSDDSDADADADAEPESETDSDSDSESDSDSAKADSSRDADD